ncbi:unnamed protein product [Fraxinus pennsylvanica]|uniref:Uncharacterized protein n=1 Tax=Fraxinus pennsylvanica TaxID=56036 RepID=A0AAD1ZLQ4_9LAMI|nr:unnamed protein product [Fraxinus pennsylvanica]
MTEISTERSLRFSVLFCSIFLQFISGYSDDSSSPINRTKTKSHSPSHSGGSTGSRRMMSLSLSLVFGIELASYLYINLIKLIRVGGSPKFSILGCSLCNNID